MICVNMDASRTAIQEAATETRTSMDLRERLALDLLGASYTQLTEQKRSVIDLIADQKPSGLGPVAKVDERDRWQKLADQVAKTGVSWGFIITFLVALALWVALNVLLATRAFDPYPFIFLNLMLSMVAALQAPIIMMSQNRQEEKDRERSKNDYKVNLKAEIIIEDIHQKLDAIMDRQQALVDQLGALDKQSKP